MDDRRWEAVGALGGGVLFVALFFASSAVAGTPPKLDDGSGTILRYYKDHVDEIRIAGALGSAAVIPLLFWLASLYRAIRRVERGEPRLALVAVLGTFLAGALFTVALALETATALRVDSVGPQNVRFFFLLTTLIAAAASFGLAAAVAAVSVAGLRGLLPAWLSWVGTVLALGWLVASLGSVSTNNALTNVWGIVFLVWLVWILAVSVVLHRRLRAPSSA
jgi:hypothetical protein